MLRFEYALVGLSNCVVEIRTFNKSFINEEKLVAPGFPRQLRRSNISVYAYNFGGLIYFDEGIDLFATQYICDASTLAPAPVP